MSMQETNNDLKEIKKLKRKNIFLIILAAFINITAAVAVFVCLLMVFGGPIFDHPLNLPSTRWYSDNPQIELVIEENFKNEGQGHPITVTIDGQKETYHIFIHSSSRSVWISKGSDPNNSPKIISGLFDSRLTKFIINVKECNDVRFSQYDKIVLYKDSKP